MGSYTPEQQEYVDGVARRRRLWRRHLPAVAAVLLVLVGVYFTARWFQGRSIQRHGMETARTAWPSLERCLIGPPLASGERPVDRLRRIEIASAYANPTIVGTEPGQWPRRCAPFAKEYERAHAMSGVRGSGHASSSLMAGELHDPESLWAGAAPFAGIEPIAEADPDAVAPAATFLVEPKWASLGGVEWVVSDRPSSQGLRLWFAASGEKGVACAFGRLDDPKAVARASCHRLDEAGGLRWPGGGLFVDAEQGKRLLLWDRPESRILSAETNEVLVKGVSASHGSYVGRDDSITLLGPHQLSMLLWRRTSDGRIEQHELDTSSKMKMFWDHRVWMDGEEEARLHAHRVGERLDAPGPELDLGELSGDVMGNSLEACRADGTLVVEARRDDAINGAFAMITSKGFVPARSVDIMQGHLSCRPDGASWTAVYFQSLDPYPHDVVVGQTRCSAAGCERFNARFPGIEPAPPTLNGTWTKSGGRRAAGDSADAIDLGDKTLLVWARADDKSAFGSRERLVSLWMRLAPMAELERAPAAMLIAPERAVHSRIRVFARNNAAIVILRRGADQVAAIRIDASGKASSIDLAVK